MASIKFEGGEKLKAALEQMREKLGRAQNLDVGFMEGRDYPDDGASVATVAATQNFGDPAAGIPPRPFFSDMVQTESPRWGEKLGAILKGANLDAELAMGRMGELLSNQLRASITTGTFAPNSMVTNLLKQRFPMRDGMTSEDVSKARHDVAAGETAPAGKPLVWSGIMLAAVQYAVDGAVAQ